MEAARLKLLMAQRDTYTHGHAESVLRSHRWRTATNSAGYLLPRLSAGQRLLDLGCGPGTITLDLARLVAPGEVVGLDREQRPLAEARVAAANAGVTNVCFILGDAYRLGFPDRSFDVVHAHQVLQHLRDPVAALAEMRRVCASGGWIAVRDADYAAMTWYPDDERLHRWLALYRAVARGNRAEPDAGRRLVSWARAAGLTELTSTASVWCYSSPEERAWWGGLWAERITASALAEQAVSRGLATRDELGVYAEGWRWWSRQDDGWFAVLHGEVLARRD
jgi:SAM-dependent methyltransferase